MFELVQSIKPVPKNIRLVSAAAVVQSIKSGPKNISLVSVEAALDGDIGEGYYRGLGGLSV